MTETDHLAAEYALGLLEGEELLRARRLEARDPAFASEVARWQAHFAPLLDEVPAAQPRAGLWQGIEAQLGPAPANDNAVLAGQVRRWQWATAFASAAAAVLLAVSLMPPRAAPVADAPELAASIPVGESGLRLEVTYIGQSRELVVAAAGLTADGVHDHELWVVTGQASPRSLGVVEPGTIRKARLDAALAAQLADGAQLLLTREPLGGAPAGGKAGPVVAEGSFTAL
jgi:anti-sigma-K factor RskA